MLKKLSTFAFWIQFNPLMWGCNGFIDTSVPEVPDIFSFLVFCLGPITLTYSCLNNTSTHGMTSTGIGFDVKFLFTRLNS